MGNAEAAAPAAQPELLKMEITGRVMTVGLNRPAKRNALNDGIILAIGDCFANLPDDIGAVVIHGVGDHFSSGLDLSELVAIGNEGLLKAVRKFDPDQGVKFISYAVWWVRQAVLKALAEQTRSVRIPLNQNSQLIRLARAETILAQVLKRDPTEEEISHLLAETPETVRAAKQMSATEVSLDAPIDRSDREASTLGERFAGVDGGEIEDLCDYKLMREFIDRVFRKYLSPRERKILYLYYGLEEGSEAMTLEKIGALMGVTRERIRQIRERAFEKLRESPDGRALCGFWAA